MIEQYNSKKHVPQMIFLGLDERVKGGFSYEKKGNVYHGAPHFALDVTPRDNVRDACEKLLADVQTKGLTFAGGRAMDLDAPDGEYSRPPSLLCPHFSPFPFPSSDLPFFSSLLPSALPTLNHHSTDNPQKPPSMQRPANCSTGTSATPSAPNAATQPFPSTVASSAHARQMTWQTCPRQHK